VDTPNTPPSAYTALEKQSCPACGAQAEWSARKHMLVCPFCGTESPAELESDTGKIIEHDLVTALREVPDEMRGWQEERRTVKCQSCKAITVFDPEKVASRCDFCNSPELVDYEEIRSPLRPESILPFKINREQVHATIKSWLGSRWFAPNALKSRSLVDTVHGVYIPYWTFDSEVHCPWTADSGTYYWVSESYTDAQGKRGTRQVRKTRWTPASGAIDHTFDDVLIPGTSGVDRKLLARIENFPTVSDLVPYDKGYVSGWDVEHYQVVLFDAAEQARAKKITALEGLCGSAVPGDTHRNLQISPSFSEQTFKLVLVPVWLLVYDFGRQRNQVLVNGYTGAIAGTYPKSAWKIFFAVLAALVVIALILFFSNR
jgi:hypothetical protein